MLLQLAARHLALPPNSYEAPTPLVVENEAFTTAPFGQIWDKLVKDRATHFYMINNIGKESRLINVSFSSNTPEQYVTGGMTTREFRRKPAVEHFAYDPDASSSHKIGWKWGPYNNPPSTGIISRRTSLKGRANIYVAPDGDGTRVTVNCRYV